VEPATTTRPNFELVDRIFEHIERIPWKWNQRSFVAPAGRPIIFGLQRSINECGTTFCFAGFALLLTDHLTEFGLVKMTGHSISDYESAAIEVLGITLEQADQIFYGTSIDMQDIEEFKQLVKEVLSEH